MLRSCTDQYQNQTCSRHRLPFTCPWYVTSCTTSPYSLMTTSLSILRSHSRGAISHLAELALIPDLSVFLMDGNDWLWRCFAYLWSGDVACEGWSSLWCYLIACDWSGRRVDVTGLSDHHNHHIVILDSLTNADGFQIIFESYSVLICSSGCTRITTTTFAITPLSIERSPCTRVSPHALLRDFTWSSSLVYAISG